MEGFIPEKSGISCYQGNRLIVLGIESSCDETAAAICSQGRILASIVNSQEIHTLYGGVVPELAAREHERYLNSIVDRVMERSGLVLTDLEGLAVTQGPGLAGTLLTGVCFAKGLALNLSLPILGVNHLEAHIFANFLAEPDLTYPFVCLLVSGGHTQLWYIKGLQDYQLLGTSRDDAAGEAFDKGARILGLKYPGGPEIERLAAGGDNHAVDFPRAFINSPELEFSFSGLKTALLYFMDDVKSGRKTAHIVDVAASYQAAIIDVLTVKLAQAVSRTGVSTCVIAGGVAANTYLRQSVTDIFENEVKVLFPEQALCTDNAAMVAYLGEIYLSKGISTALDFPVKPNFSLVKK